MAAQAALSVFSISNPAANTLGILPESNLLVGSYSESATRTRSGIVGAISGCTIRAAYSDPVLTISIGGWVITRGGFANCAPGALIDCSIIANWRNGAERARTEAERRADVYPRETFDSFGWDVMNPGNKFIVQDPSITRTKGGMSEASLKLILDCTGGKGATTAPAENGGDPPPEVGTVYRIVTIYTDKGPFQVLSTDTVPDMGKVFGSAHGQWNEGAHERPVGSIGKEYVASDVGSPPYNVLGVNVQAPSGYGSPAGGEWLNGSASEVTTAGWPLKPAGLDIWIFSYPTDGQYNRTNSEIITGALSTQSSALAAFPVTKTADDFSLIYHNRTGFTKDTDPPSGLDPLAWFFNK